jgi:hypothetical protein
MLHNLKAKWVSRKCWAQISESATEDLESLDWVNAKFEQIYGESLDFTQLGDIFRNYKQECSEWEHYYENKYKLFIRWRPEMTKKEILESEDFRDSFFRNIYKPLAQSIVRADKDYRKKNFETWRLVMTNEEAALKATSQTYGNFPTRAGLIDKDKKINYNRSNNNNNDNNQITKKICKYGGKCTREGCSFEHPKSGVINNNKDV